MESQPVQKKCVTCKQACKVCISKSDKNPGRPYYRCASGCKEWNGWAPLTHKESSSQKRPSGGGSGGATKKAKTALSCRACKAEVDPEWEFYLTSVGKSARLQIPLKEIQRMTRGEFMREIVTSADFRCEYCHVKAMNYFK